MGVFLSSIRIEAAYDSSQYTRGAQQQVDADKQMIGSSQQLGATVETTQRKLGTSTTALERLTKAVDDNYRSSVLIEKGQRTLQSALDAGAISAEEYARRLALVEQHYAVHTPAAKAAADATRAVGTAAKLTYTDVEILRSGLINTVQSLAAGEGAARTLQTQLVQTAPAFGALGRAIGGLGTVAAVAGLAAVAGGLALILSRASQAETQLRSFRVILQATGNTQVGSPQGLLALTRQLRDSGSTTDQAQSLAEAAARTPGINPSSYASLANLARDIGAGTGQQATTVVAALEQALLGGADAAAKFVYGLTGPNGLTAAEAANMRAMELHGDRAGAVTIAIGALQRRFGGEFKDSLSESTKSINAMTTAWNDMLDKLADTKFIQAARTAITDMLKGISQAVSGDTPGGISTAAGGFNRLFPLSPPAIFSGMSGVASSAAGALWNALPNTGDAAANQQATANALRARNGDLGIGGALRSVSTSSANLSGLDAEFSRRLNEWLAALDDVDRAAIRITSGFAASGHAPGSAHYSGLAVDSHGLSAVARSRLSAFGLQEAVPGDPGHIEPIETPNAGSATAAARRQAFAQIKASGGLGVSADLLRGAGLNGGGTISNSLSDQDLDQLKRGSEEFERAAAAARKLGDDNLYAKTYVDALAASSLTGNAKIYEAEQKASEAVEMHRIELQKTADTQKLTNDLAVKTADAFGNDEVKGYQAAALAQATLAARQGDALDVQSKYNELLRTGAVQAIDAAARVIPSLVQQTAASQRLADASAKGSAAEHEAELQNQATTATHDALAKAIASGDAGLVSRVQKLQDLTLAQIKANDAATQAKAINDSINQRTDQIAVIGVQRASLGQTPEAVQAATAALQEQFRLRDLGASVSDKQKADDLASVAALGQANIQLADAARNQQRWEDGIRSAADTVDNTLVSAIESAFDPTKVTNWAQTIKNALASITSGLLNSLLVKPAIGSLLGAFGQNNLATQYGSFSSVFGGGGLFGSGSLFGSQGPLRGTAADISIAGGGPPLSLGAEGQGLFDASGGASGLGLSGAGLLGTVGSALPYVGLAVAAGSLLGGLFSNSKPKNQAAGGNIDLATGRVNGAFSGGNSQIDSATSQATSQIGQFIQQITGATGGSLSGSVLLQGGVNTGFTADSTLPGYTGQYNLGKDATQAVGTVELALAHSLQGVSATVQQIINTVTDPSQLATAVQFAKTYDDLKDAFDGAFQSISADTKKIGPFQDALNQINTTFDSLTQQAQQYGLSLDPVNQARTDSLARLNQDFTKNISDLMLAITDPVKLSIEQEREAGQQRVQDAIAIGASLEQVNRLNAASLENIWKQQTQSLQQLSDSLKSGALSGLTILDQLSAANDNFQKELGLVQGGNLAEIGNFATAGQNAVSLAQTAYGNGPQTAAIHNTVASAVDSVLSSRSFAGGTDYTPPGWVRVGEAGPEWMYQPGGATVLPNGSSPTGGNLGGKIDRLAALIDTGNRILQAVGSEQVTQLRGARSALERNPPVAYQKQPVA